MQSEQDLSNRNVDTLRDAYAGVEASKSSMVCSLQGNRIVLPLTLLGISRCSQWNGWKTEPHCRRTSFWPNPSWNKPRREPKSPCLRPPKRQRKPVNSRPWFRNFMRKLCKSRLRKTWQRFAVPQAESINEYYYYVSCLSRSGSPFRPSCVRLLSLGRKWRRTMRITRAWLAASKSAWIRMNWVLV